MREITFQQSVGLMRRVLRRKIEIEHKHKSDALKSFDHFTVLPSCVPDIVSFKFSVRLLRRVIRRVIEQAG